MTKKVVLKIKLTTIEYQRVVLKIKLTTVEYQRDRNIRICIRPTISQVTETSMKQTEPSRKMQQREVAYLIHPV